MEKEIPIISLQEIQQGSERVREACKTWGCFRLINHGISTDLMSKMKSTTKALFNRPMLSDGVVSKCGKLSFVSKKERAPHYEGILFSDVPCAPSDARFCSEFQVSPQEREIIEEYNEAVDKLTRNVVNKIAANLGEPKEEEWSIAFRLNKFNFGDQTNGSLGVQPHTDTGFLTMLQDDEIVAGLEVMDSSGVFFPVQPVPDGFFVNIGDIAVYDLLDKSNMLVDREKVWSNGELRNVQHRVRCKVPETRYSIAKFAYPPSEKVIQPQECFMKADEHPRYPPITNREYVKLRDSEKLNVGQVLDRIRLTK